MNAGRVALFAVVLLATQALIVPNAVLNRAAAQALDRSARPRPEAIAVEDITRSSGCKLHIEEYDDAARTRLVRSRPLDCAPGSVLHTFHITRAEARALGRSHQVLTGNEKADKAELEKLKRQLKPKHGTSADEVEAQFAFAWGGLDLVPALQQQEVCYSKYFTAVLYYWARNEGKQLKLSVNYHRLTSPPERCHMIQIDGSYIKFVQDTRPSADLYWDEGVYSGAYNGIARDMGCQQIGWSTRYRGFDWWYGLADRWYDDETINDTSLGCSWWGEEYLGSVPLWN